MNYQRITKLQKDYGYHNLQESINSGIVWKMEGSQGRAAMHALECGICMLPKEPKFDYYGNKIPSRDWLQKGTKGTFQNCTKFWQGVEGGSIYLQKELS